VLKILPASQGELLKKPAAKEERGKNPPKESFGQTSRQTTEIITPKEFPKNLLLFLSLKFFHSLYNT